MFEFRMPSLGADMEAGTLTAWRVKPGDHVRRGDIVAEVETAKANVEVEVFQTGVVDRLVGELGQKLPVGTVLAYIRSDGEAPTAEKPARAPASPMARKLAREFGIDLASIAGTGPHGVIEGKDVERAAAGAKPRPAAPAAQPPQAPATKVPSQPAMRQAIAAAMSRSNREIPHYYLETHVDMHAALRRLEATNLERSIEKRILPAALLLKATANALVQVPELNGYWIDDRLQVKEGIHIGMAISLRGGGLVIPAIHDVDEKTLDEVMETMHDVIMRARAGRLRSSELTDATITVTNLGDLGIETVFGVIYPPQVALIGFGKILQRVWVTDDLIGIRPILGVSLAGDHRATDGHRGAQFLAAFEHALAEPDKL